MTEPSIDENLRPDDWRAALPTRWPPIVVYGVFAIFLLFNSSGDGPARYFVPRRVVDLLYWNSFAVLVALSAMLRIKVRYRLAILLAIELIRLFIRFQVTAADEIVSSNWSDHFRTLGNQLAIDVVDFAFISTVAHCITSLCGAHVSATAPDQVTLERGAQAGIAEWLYFTLIVGLIFLPQPARVFSSLQMTWEPFGWRSLYRLLFEQPNRVMVPLFGLLLLSHLRGWRFALLIIALIGSLWVWPILRPPGWGRGRIPLATLLMMVVMPVFLSLPFWLLLRWAGYRLYSPRRWIYSPKPKDKQPEIFVGP